MMENEDKWVKRLRERMEDYAEPCPEGLWEKLEKDLPSFHVIPMWRRKWFVSAAAVAMLLAVSSVTVWFTDSSSEALHQGNQLVRQIEEQVSAPTGMEPSAAETLSDPVKEILAEGTPLFHGLDNSPVPKAPDNSLALAVMAVPADSVDGIWVEKEGQVPDSRGIPEETERKPVVDSKRRMEEDRRKMQRNRSYLAEEVGEKRKRRHVAIGLNAGNTPLTSSTAIDGFARFASLTDNSVNLEGSLQDVISPYPSNTFNKQPIMYKSDAQSTTRVNHKMPVTVGASVKWALDDKWAVETGLNYTLLSSELTTGEITYVKEEQKLHYIGIPLKFQRFLWENKLFVLYASVGGMIEKCISNTLESVSVDKDLHKHKERESAGEKPVQLSLGAAVGAQLNLGRYFGIYVEPGAAYYFDDGTNLETIRKEHPLNFSLQLGVRVNLNE